MSLSISLSKICNRKWIINTRGYANIIPSPDHTVHGLIYELGEKDEDRLDRFEGLGDAYEKKILKVNLISATASNVDIKQITVMTYIDDKRVEEGKIIDEYIGRMNKAIEDGIEEGISEKYFELNVCPFIL